MGSNGGGDWLLWQLIDTAFPAGGMSHSAGFEAAWQSGEVDGDVRAFVRTHVAQQGHAMIPFVVAAARNPNGFAGIDLRCDATIANHVTNRASRSQGRSLLSAARRAFGDERFEPLAHAVAVNGQPGHQAPLTGAIGAALGLSADTMGRAFLFVSTRAVVSAAVRTGAVGPFEGQAIQFELRDFVEHVARRSVTIPVDDACQVAPLLDVVQGAQDRLYSRLFVS